GDSYFSSEKLAQLDFYVQWQNYSVSEKYDYLWRKKLQESETPQSLLYLKTRQSKFTFNPSPQIKDETWENWQNQLEEEELVLPGDLSGNACGNYEKGVDLVKLKPISSPWLESVACWWEGIKEFEIVEDNNFQAVYAEFEADFKSSWENWGKDFSGGWQSFVEKLKNPAAVDDSLALALELPAAMDLLEPRADEDFWFYLPIKSNKNWSGVANLVLPANLETNLEDLDLENPGLQIALSFSPQTEIPLVAKGKITSEKLQLTVDNQDYWLDVNTVNYPSLNLDIQTEKIESMIKAELEISTQTPFQGKFPIYFQTEDPVVLSQKTVWLKDGKAKIALAYPVLNRDLNLKISSPYLNQLQDFNLARQANSLAEIQALARYIQVPQTKYWAKVGESITIPVQILDWEKRVLGEMGNNYRLELYVSPQSLKYSDLANQYLYVNNEGKAEFTFQVKEAGVINLAIMKKVEGKNVLVPTLIQIEAGIVIENDEITTSPAAFTYWISDSFRPNLDLMQSLLIKGGIA
nr:hypothetical protein [Candidatus Gracilibacteria bacterium]